MTREEYVKTLRDDPNPKPLTPPAQDKASVSASGQGAGNEGVPIVDYHKDSYPVVAVVMLSDVSNMKGGETAICE